MIFFIILFLSYTVHASEATNQTARYQEVLEVCKQEMQDAAGIAITGDQSLPTDFFRNLAALLKDNNSLETINLNYSFIGDTHIKLLIPAIQSMSRLSKLQLYQTGLTDDGITFLCSAFVAQKPPALHVLDLSSNQGYGLEGVATIQALQKKYPDLEIKRTVGAALLRNLQQ